MTSDALNLPDWLRAMSIRERIAASIHGSSSDGPLADLAERKLARWKSQPPFTSRNLFARRLNAQGLDEATLRRLLRESPKELRKRVAADPEWLTELVTAYGNSESGDQTAKYKAAPRDELNLLGVVRPLIQNGMNRLDNLVHRLLREHPKAPIDAQSVPALFLPRLCGQLLDLIGRTIAVELNVARLQGALPGETAEERYQQFVENLNRPDQAIVLLSEYPVLARLAVSFVDRWVETTIEFLNRLAEDWSTIQETFRADLPGHNSGILSEVSGDAGDTHHGGRAVAVVTFSDGFKLVYKPRSLAMDCHFQDLLGWVNQRTERTKFRRIKVLDRTSHGWVEFVSSAGCDTVDQLQRFFRRQGGYLAILYLVQATDFHYENIIAAGEHPVLIDMESLFHPRLVDPPGTVPLSEIDYDYKSLFRSGLLPPIPNSKAFDEGLDLSGLGGAAGQVTSKALHQWVGLRTDEMKLEAKPSNFDGGKNRATLQGQDVRPADHWETIADGFSEIYRTFIRCREELLAEGGPLDVFASDEVRVILRRTHLYVTLLNDSFNPDVLRDALDRERLLDRLWAPVEHHPEVAEAVGREREELMRGDVPRFTTRPNSTELGSGDENPIRNFFAETPLAQIRRRVRRLDEDDLARQIDAITMSLNGPHTRATTPPY